jgi:hypothetical protein
MVRGVSIGRGQDLVIIRWASSLSTHCRPRALLTSSEMRRFASVIV